MNFRPLEKIQSTYISQNSNWGRFRGRNGSSVGGSCGGHGLMKQRRGRTKSRQSRGGGGGSGEVKFDQVSPVTVLHFDYEGEDG